MCFLQWAKCRAAPGSHGRQNKVQEWGGKKLGKQFHLGSSHVVNNMLDSDQFDMPAAASVKQTIYHRIWNIILFVLKVSIFSFLEGSKEYFVHKSQHGILESTKKWIVCLSSGQVLCRWSQSSFVVLHYKVFNLDLRGQFFLLYLQPPSKTEKKNKKPRRQKNHSLF